jgi:hypothetical protein
MKKTWLFAACVLCSALALFAQTTREFWTEFVNGRVAITGYSGSVNDLRIPAQINGLPVTSIGEEGFSGTGLMSIIIPNSITSIGEEAFDDVRR